MAAHPAPLAMLDNNHKVAPIAHPTKSKTVPSIIAVPSSSSSTQTSSSANTAGSLGPPALTISSLSCTHDGGQTYQLESACYILPRYRKIGLVGRNGCGKSTLLRIIATECDDGNLLSIANSIANDGFKYTGTVEKPRDVTVGIVEQDPPSPSDVTVGDAILGITSASLPDQSSGNNNNVYDVVRQYRLALSGSSASSSLLSSLTTQMESMEGWSILTRAEELATRFEISHLSSSPLSHLSGGERKRVAIAAAMLSNPDVLLMDEPTNHLDLEAIRLLEDVLSSQKLTLMVVTHDRAFLENVCDIVLELDQGSLYEYCGTGGYRTFLEGKEERLRLADAAVSNAKVMYKKELEWMRRQPQARQSKSQARIDAFYKLEKMVTPRAREGVLDIADSAGGGRRIGKSVLKLDNVSLSFSERQMLRDFSYDFNRGDRIGIVGGNGVGKTTFLNVLTGRQAPDAGTLSTGETVVFGIYDQRGLDVPEQDTTVLDFVKESVLARDGSTMAEAPGEAMTLLRKFEFSRNRWQTRLSVLSGGERRRLQLLSVLTKRPNFLILDEPTNDVDIDTLSVIETYLTEEFKGVLVVVSHDRYFVDKVTDHLFVFEGDGVVRDFKGTLTDYAEGLLERETRKKNAAAAGTSGTTSAGGGGGTSYKEDKAKRNERRNELRKMKKEMLSLDTKMDKLKEEAGKLQKEIDGSADEGWSVLADLTSKLNSINEDVEEMELRWLELAEELEEAEATGEVS
eukprot:CAMPEP_0172497516 /NCGR_PEP_ID=MMETSP1066-20121228/101092_1 /TAXON_ID=671091 /ORGANISM="Coscinodiscus wailesii, Strain CCMP2513" /LENGTH=740 /DNA_ID=CAMNT_0013270341 /DNA_START=66 /DNA_END=2289 /DNA_ORIENTATION=+